MRFAVAIAVSLCAGFLTGLVPLLKPAEIDMAVALLSPAGPWDGACWGPCGEWLGYPDDDDYPPVVLYSWCEPST